MTVKLTPQIQELVAEQILSGEFVTAEEVLLAGLQALSASRFGDFEPGELEELLAEGERSIREEGTLDVDEAFEQRRLRRWDLRKIFRRSQQ